MTSHGGHSFSFPQISGLILFLILFQWPLVAQNLRPAATPDSQQRSPLTEVLRQIEEHFDINFLFDDALVKGKTAPIISSFDLSLEDVLGRVLSSAQLTYSLIGKSTYILSPLAKAHAPGQNPQWIGRIRGICLTSTGDPLAGTNIVLAGTGMGTTSDLDGYFEIRNVLPGEYLLRASFLGYKTVLENVSIVREEKAFARLILHQDFLKMDAVISTGTYSSRTQREAPISLMVLSSKDLQDLASNSQADILRTVPGVHAEGGGGEVAANVFVRGLPAAGQYKYNPIQIDGMPLQATFGLTSSAQDVYFRHDLGFKSMEFARGGATTMFGVGSVAGIINYRSIKGGSIQQTNLQLEWATEQRYKIDFNTSGPLSAANNLFYSLTGFYRYDEGPIRTGLSSQGYQLRANLHKIQPNGSFTIYTQFINDRVQFYLPLPLRGGTRERAIGNDGKTVYTIQNAQAADISYRTPDGIYQSPIEDGVSTRGASFMVDYTQSLNSNWHFSGKMRAAQFDHHFNLFLTGSGMPPIDVETQQGYIQRTIASPIKEASFTYNDNGQPLSEEDRLFESRILDRQRPFFEMAADLNIARVFLPGPTKHRITAGTFLARTEASDINIVTGYLGDFRDQPRLVNLEAVTTNGDTVTVSRNGLTNPGAGYTNNKARSNKMAFYLADEIEYDRLRVDAGVRYEVNAADVVREGNRSFAVDNDQHLAPLLRNVHWGNGSFERRRISPDAWAASAAVSYGVQKNTNVYANMAQGFFFPELRGDISFARDSSGRYFQKDPPVERIKQAEVGIKFSGDHVSTTAAIYGLQINDRFETDLVNGPDGSIIEFSRPVGQTATIGAEWTFGLRLAIPFILDGSFTYQRHQVDESISGELEGKWLRRQPRVMANLGIGYQEGAVDARIFGKFIGRRFSNSANTIELDSYNILRMEAGYKMTLARQQSLRISCHIFNILDDDAITEADPRQANNQSEGDFLIGRPILPRRFSFRAELKF